MSETKRCTKCGVEHPATLEWFYRQSKRPDGLNCWCKDCSNAQHRAQEHRKSEQRYSKYLDQLAIKARQYDR